MAYAYAADMYCDDCGQLIIADIKQAGTAPDDPDNGASFDSDEYPKHGDDEEAVDSPNHCGSGAECVNAIELSNGRKVGCLIGTTLTEDGVEYVKQAIREGGLVATEVWKVEFSAYLDDEEEEDD